MIAQFCIKTVRVLISVLAVLTLTSCESSPITVKSTKKVPSVGERLHEALLVSQDGQQCQPQKQLFLSQKKADIVDSIDLLLKDIRALDPDKALLKQRLDWLLYTPLELGLDELAFVLNATADPLQKEINFLFPFAQTPFLSESFLSNTLDILKMPEVRELESRLSLGISSETKHAIAQIKEHLNSDRGRFIIETLLSINDHYTLTESSVLELHTILQNEDVQYLLGRLLVGISQVIHPDPNTHAFFKLVKSISDRIAIGDNHFSLSKEEIMGLIRVLQSDELELLIEGLYFKDILKDAELLLENLKPFYAFIKSKDAANFIAFIKRIFTDSQTRTFIFDFSDFAENQRGFFEEYFLSFCLGESWTSLSPARKICLQRMKWAGLDPQLSEEFLDHASLLYKKNLITDALNLEPLLNELRHKYRDEVALTKMMAKSLHITGEQEGNFDLRSYFENEENRGLALYFLEEIFDRQLDRDIIRAYQHVHKLYNDNRGDLEILARVLRNGTLAYKTLEITRMEGLIDFALKSESQLAFHALKDMIREGLGEQIHLLVLTILNLPTTEARTFASLREILKASHIDLSLPSRKTIRHLYDFLHDEEKIESIKRIAQLSFRTMTRLHQFSASFQSFPREPVDLWSQETRDKVFERIDSLSHSHTRALALLLNTGFDLWSISTSGHCQIPAERILKARNIGQGLKSWSAFLVDEQNGLKSILSLFRRIAQDSTSL